MSDDSRKFIKKGLIWTSVSQFSGVVAQFISLMVLSRYLSVDDFAIMGILIFFISISTVLVDAGMGGSLIGKKNVEPIDYSTLFLYNIIVSAIIYILLFGLSGLIESYYKVENLAFLLRISNLVIIISAIGIVQNVILYREYKFKERAIIDITASLLSICVAIYLAIQNFGVWALVLQTLTRAFLIVILQLMFNRTIPNLSFSKVSFREQWAFGSHLMFSNILSTAYNNVFNLIFPKISSLSFSGLYVQANRVKQLPVGIFTSIIDKATFPVLSKMDDPEKFLATNRSVSVKIYLLTFCIFFYISLFSTPLISLLLGNKWNDAGRILSVIAFAGIGLVVMAVNRNTLKSMSLTKKISYLEVIKSSIGLGCLLITCIGGDWAILWGLVMASIVSAIVSIYMVSCNSNYSWYLQIADIFSILKIFIVPYILTYLFISCIPAMNKILELLLGSILFLLLCLIASFLLKNRDVMNFLKIKK